MNNFDEKMMQRCIELAQLGLGRTYPNPLVGCVIVHEKQIISEGWHQKAGEAHAEVNAIQSVENKEILKKSTLYVSLEPCAHQGKTPPCADLIIQYQIPRVVVGTSDPFAKVNGLGIQKMKEAGIEVKLGVREQESREINKRFFTFHQKNRPYILLKWAETKDGFIAPADENQKWISNHFSKQLVHKWRTEEQGILVGTATAKIDNPQLNARLWEGNQPVRMVLDRDLKLNSSLNLLDRTQSTLVFTEQSKESSKDLEYISVSFDEYLAEQILRELYKRGIQSVIIEGGKQTLETFIRKGLWDEARVFKSSNNWGVGIPSPEISGQLIECRNIGNDKLEIYQK